MRAYAYLRVRARVRLRACELCECACQRLYVRACMCVCKPVRVRECQRLHVHLHVACCACAHASVRVRACERVCARAFLSMHGIARIRCIARVRRDTDLAGRTFFDSAQVDSGMDFCTTEVELPASLLTFPILGLAEARAGVDAAAAADLRKALAVL